MAEQEDNWGPEIQEYSRHFDLHPTDSSDPLWETDFPGAWRGDHIIPIRVLESSLSRSDLKSGYCYGDRPLTALLSTLWNYHKSTQHNVRTAYISVSIGTRMLTHADRFSNIIMASCVYDVSYIWFASACFSKPNP